VYTQEDKFTVRDEFCLPIGTNVVHRLPLHQPLPELDFQPIIFTQPLVVTTGITGRPIVRLFLFLMLPLFPLLVCSRVRPFIRCFGLLLGLSITTTVVNAQNFGVPVRYTTGSGPQGIAVADVNADGRPDLITADYLSNTVSVLLHQATNSATFSATPTAYSSGGNRPVDVATGDVNGDGRLDIVLSNTATNTVGVLLNSPTSPGTFLPAVTYASGDYEPRGLALGDVNGDGRLDIAVANQSGNSVCVLLNSATTPGSFSAPTRYITGTLSIDLVLRDVNGDGLLDMGVLTNGAIVVLLNSAAAPGTFLPAVSYPSTSASGGNYYSLAMGDVNGDGRPDLIFTILDTNSVGILLNSATTPGTFITPLSLYPTNIRGPYGVTLGDINGDGRLDIALASYDGGNGSTVSVLLNSATTPGTFPTAATVLTSGGRAPVIVVAHDLNGDGRLDLAVTNFRSDEVSVFTNTATYLASTPALAATEVALYPNPAHSSFTLELPTLAEATRVQAELLNTLGQVVRQQQVLTSEHSARLTVATAGLAAGVYTLRLQAGATTLTKRVVVE
jgi:hypothetical protein